MGLLSGKVGVVYGVTNHLSIGWGVAQAWRRSGAQVVLSVQSDRFRPKVEKLINGDQGFHVVTCDVNNDEEVSASVEEACRLCNSVEKLDMLLHSVAHAPKESLASVLGTSRQDFSLTFETSVYSLVALANAAAPKLRNGGSILSLTFAGSTRVVPGYGLMGPAKAALESTSRYLASEFGSRGIRVNAISAGALNTISARGIKDFHTLRSRAEAQSPLQRRLETGDIGDMAVFLASDMAQSITGQTIYVDCGHNIMSS